VFDHGLGMAALWGDEVENRKRAPTETVRGGPGLGGERVGRLCLKFATWSF
jgi:hypothetical protein